MTDQFKPTYDDVFYLPSHRIAKINEALQYLVDNNVPSDFKDAHDLLDALNNEEWEAHHWYVTDARGMPGTAGNSSILIGNCDVRVSGVQPNGKRFIETVYPLINQETNTVYEREQLRYFKTWGVNRQEHPDPEDLRAYRRKIAAQFERHYAKTFAHTRGARIIDIPAGPKRGLDMIQRKNKMRFG